jgi:hypothetical protein
MRTKPLSVVFILAKAENKKRGRETLFKDFEALSPKK